MSLQCDRSSEIIGRRLRHVFTIAFMSCRLESLPMLVGARPWLIWAASCSSIICWAAWNIKRVKVKRQRVIQGQMSIVRDTCYLIKEVGPTWNEMHQSIYKICYRWRDISTVKSLYKGHPWSEDKFTTTEGCIWSGKSRCKRILMIVLAFTEALAFPEGGLCRGVRLYINSNTSIMYVTMPKHQLRAIW